MPCHDDRTDTEMAEMKVRLDLATRVACTAMKMIDGLRVDFGDALEALRWWEEHKESDAARSGK